MSAIVWYRRDLRVHDHPALRAALAAHDVVVPAFCLDNRLLHGRHSSGARTQFMLECLHDLNTALRKRGGGLVVLHGRPERELARLAEEIGAGELHYTADVSPFARERGRRTHAALRELRVEMHAHPGLGVLDDLGSARTQSGNPYTVFSPYHRTWEREPRREALAAPRRLPPLPRGLAKGRIPSLQALGLEQEVTDPPPGGETQGRRRLTRFIARDVDAYEENHDALGADRTSRLSPYLRFGCVSALEVEQRARASLDRSGAGIGSNNEGSDDGGGAGQSGADGRPGSGSGAGEGGAGVAALCRQLAWRDFYHHVLLHHPRNAHSEHQARYRGTIKWSYAERRFEAWCEGRTGYPLVDAGMRQLRAEGWMHNRARLVVGSFLTKDLGIDWRWGERWFMRLLVDGDEANNNGNWQWIASVGVDPQPAFKRMLNPARQQERYDPDGTYVRRYVSELTKVPDRYLAEPWTMPIEIQRAAGCVIGSDYPEPIVDHAQARERALERYRIG
jgi:deoxyribodipyrimidine photo-lyase